MPRTPRQIVTRVVLALLAIAVIVVLASLSGGPTSTAPCAHGFVHVAGHCVLPQPTSR